MYPHTHTHAHLHTHACIHRFPHACTHTCTHTCVRMHSHPCSMSQSLGTAFLKIPKLPRQSGIPCSALARLKSQRPGHKADSQLRTCHTTPAPQKVAPSWCYSLGPGMALLREQKHQGSTTSLLDQPKELGELMPINCVAKQSQESGVSVFPQGPPVIGSKVLSRLRLTSDIPHRSILQAHTLALV